VLDATASHLHDPACVPSQARAASARSRHLDRLERDAIRILREVARAHAHAALLFSGSKESLVLLRLAEKAFRPGPFPVALLHIETGHDFPEVVAFRDHRAAELGQRLIARPVEATHAFDALVGACRGETTRGVKPVRVSPSVLALACWTELDVWHYIARERLQIPSLYFAHWRRVARRGGRLAPVTALTPARDDERVESLQVRFHGIDDVTSASAVPSAAMDVDAVIAEVVAGGDAAAAAGIIRPS
jgi:sulfate adenylyltransferase subunit 2